MTNPILYPFKFRPRLVEKMWGGRRLETVLGKPLPAGAPVGESWELYDFPPGVIAGEGGWVSAPVSDGPLAGRTLHSLVEEFGAAFHGDVPLIAPHGQFPILIKYLDAKENLSVQVHPDAAYATAHPGAHLKTEAWYIVAADPDARLYKDLRPGVTREQFAAALDSATVDQLLQAPPVKPGQCYYLPSGTVHALGAGILAAEVQTPSDTTFRVFDFNRIDPATGRRRTLHVQEALECIHFGASPAPPQKRSHVAGHFVTVTRLCASPYFVVEKVRFVEGVEQPIPYDQPVVWMMLEGQATVRVKGLADPVTLSKGDTVLLPARMNEPIIRTLADSVWLEVTFPQRG